MSKFLIVIFCWVSAIAMNAHGQIVRGRVIDQDLKFLRATITNKTSKKSVLSDSLGFYNVLAVRGDTLVYRSLGLTDELRVVSNTNQPINVLIIKKEWNDGFLVTEKQRRKGEKHLQKRYKLIEEKAEKRGLDLLTIIRFQRFSL